MRVLCRHGHFAFYPREVTDIARFSNKFDFDLEREEDYYTFSRLKDAPHYSLAAKPYINFPATKTFEGKPWEVMRENNLVYNIALGLVVPKLTVLGLIELSQADFFFISDTALIQPGVRTLLGRQILSYSGEIYIDKFQMRVTEFDYE